MAMNPIPSTPTVAIARELRRLGLKQGRGGDFTVAGDYVNGERRFTYVTLYRREAEVLVAERADEIEERTANGPFPFKVSVRYMGDRPVASIHNGAAERVRELPESARTAADEQPAEEAPEAPAATETADAPQAAVEVDPTDWRAEQAARALAWSSKHAAAVRAAVDGHLLRDEDGTPRLVARPGLAGTPIAAGRLIPLEAAGYLVHGDADEHGRRPILATADARRALALWDHFQPAPVERGRKQEHQALPPLQGGEEHQRRAAKFRAEQAQREVEREWLYAELEQRHAAEALEDRCWDAWARVQDITHRLGRKVPAGWAPTEEEAQLHSLDPEIVALLRQRAAEAAEQAPRDTDTAAAVDGPQQAEQAPAQGELWNGRPGPIPGPGVVEPGMHVEYLPPFRPGARTRHCHGGTIVSVGTTCVRWRPYKWHQDVRTPLEHMRIDPNMHVNQREWVRRMAADLDAGRKLTRHPEWTVWSLAQHLEHAAEQAAAAAALEEAPAPAEAPAPRVVVIPCGGAKQAQAAPAGELYTGGYHRACRRAADALTAQGGTVLVLSALHGLVPLDQVLEPYDVRMGQPGSVTPARLAEQARALGVDQAADVTVLGGAAYTAAALTVWPEAATPLAGLGGMGYQLQALAAIAAGAAPASHLPERDIRPVDQLALSKSSCVTCEAPGRRRARPGRETDRVHRWPADPHHRRPHRHRGVRGRRLGGRGDRRPRRNAGHRPGPAGLHQRLRGAPVLRPARRARGVQRGRDHRRLTHPPPAPPWARVHPICTRTRPTHPRGHPPWPAAPLPPAPWTCSPAATAPPSPSWRPPSCSWP
ncbi:DUF6884 domain-containing protein [Streptomyces sp. SAI-127]|uniref:DUF6884 domain-containing protein n=1 Tax=Streptomyces sp. SAI-127 TaxID=2940543 RepID=UPI002475A229|nr:DUF6884 domain-containing protein [Streptomyces sp. SAI-127]MDH6489628.1 hypothetical protein [Streptomyces sp. SAI-127]